VKHGANSLKKSAIQRLRNSVVLRGVVGGEASLSALGLEKSSEVAAGVLSTAVRPEALDAYSVLSFGPGCE
jgi:hypothetical protein